MRKAFRPAVENKLRSFKNFSVPRPIFQCAIVAFLFFFSSLAISLLRTLPALQLTVSFSFPGFPYNVFVVIPFVL